MTWWTEPLAPGIIDCMQVKSEKIAYLKDMVCIVKGKTC